MPRYADSLIQVGESALPFYPQPKVVSQRGPYKTLQRSTPIARTPFVVKPRRSEYGGKGAASFRKAIKDRDGNVCQWCRMAGCLPLHVHHLKRVGMGGSKTANRHDNAITLGADCHGLHHDGHEPTREQLRDRMIVAGHIVLLTDDEMDEFDQRLGIVRSGNEKATTARTVAA